jgi:hypothetical protein|tara:strand:+ start:3832 stop:4023 length:192 start_codon:yes stop_codon:yes gene_type:complete
MKTYTIKLSLPLVYDIKATTKEGAERQARENANKDLEMMLEHNGYVDWEVLHKTRDANNEPKA